MHFKKLFPSRYLRACDFDVAREVVIDRLEEELVGQGADAESKPVLYFRGLNQGLVLNVTNGKAVAAICGDDTDRWAGNSVVLYKAQVQFKSDLVDAVRIKDVEAAVSGADLNSESKDLF